MKISLREWAKENKVWEPKTWRTFLEKDLVPFYKQAYILNALYGFLKSEKICGKTSLADIEDETLKNKIRVAIYGGVEPNKDFSTSFAKFMYDNFGICAEDVSSFEESIKHYETWGDGIKVSINSNSWINSIPIGKLVNELRSLIGDFCEKIDIKLSEIGIQESYPYAPTELIEPDTLLPQPEEKPEKLINLINEFKQNALDLSIGYNPFMTFIFYIRTIPLLALMEFLECDVDKITKLANFLELKAYSMIDQQEVNLPTKSPEKVILIWKRSSLFEQLLELQKYLENVDPTIKEVHENMIKQAIDQIHITFEPWKDYEPIFSFLNDALRDRNWCSLGVKNGRIVELSSHYKEIELPSKIWLRDFLIKISPIISAGIASLSYSMTQLEFHPLAREWIKKVIENEGKT